MMVSPVRYFIFILFYANEKKTSHECAALCATGLPSILYPLMTNPVRNMIVVSDIHIKTLFAIPENERRFYR